MRSIGKCLLLMAMMSSDSALTGCRQSAQTSSGNSPREAMQEMLFKDGRLIGLPLSTSRTDIRIVRVESASEADSIFLSLCLEQKVDRVMYNGDEWHTCQLPSHYGGSLYYHHIPMSGWNLAGTVLVASPELNRWGVTEIRFVETVK